MLLDSPELETLRHRVHQARPRRIAHRGRRTGVEGLTETRVPVDAMAPPLLIVEEAGQEQALRAGRLHDLGVVMLTAIEDEQVEHRQQTRRTRGERVLRGG